jgi:adenylylsulfate kinase-like enzyme
MALVLPTRMSFIYVDASLSVCRARDVKGLYARATTGGVGQTTSIGSEFPAAGQMRSQNLNGK